MESLTISQFLSALNTVGIACQTKKTKKINQSVSAIAALFEEHEDKTLSEWLEDYQKQLEGPKRKKSGKLIRSTEDIKNLAVLLLNATDERKYDSAIRDIEEKALTSKEWIELGQIYTGKKSKSGVAAKKLIDATFNDRYRLSKRREMLNSLF